MTFVQCDATGRDHTFRCVLGVGHTGPHESYAGGCWDNPKKTAPPEMFTHRIGASTFELPAQGPRRASLPDDAADRKNFPIATGLFDYFPDALVAVAGVSKAGNDQHNPGQPINWAREKSTDHDDTLGRHFLQRGTLDKDGQRHSAKVAWRALAALQLEIEADRLSGGTA